VALSDLIYEVPRHPRRNTFLAGLAINAAGVLLLIVIGPRLTTVARPKLIADTHYVTLVAPIYAAVLHPEASPQVARLETPKKSPPAVKHVERPPVEQAKIEPAKIQPPKPDLPKLAASAPPKPAPPAEIKANVFGAQGSEMATVHKPPREVQTGGFGDPNGIPGKGDPKRNTVTVASVGSFELPSGPGKGNGTAGSHGVSGTIRSAGFSDGVASSGPHGNVNGGVVVAGGFGDTVAPGGSSAQHQIQKKPDLQPVEIVYKPRPAYTPEARRRRVEGEVLLDVVFTASGSLHINRVVKGLGYGLDDTALAAAERIRFRPARRDGQPYDCAALVHMVFELSE